MLKSGIKLVAIAGAISLAGCSGMDTADLAGIGVGAFKAATFSDEDARQMANDACKQMDANSRVAPAGNVYAKRLNGIAKRLGSDVDGVPLNYKVYLTNEINAWAMANGCIRVYSGIMDKMSDNELEGILGHEIGHVALGHSRKRMQAAYAASLARSAAASQSGSATAAALSNSQLGELGEAFLNAQFSQSQETAADNYSFDLLTKRNISRQGLVTAFEKMAAMDGGKGSLMSSHPGSEKRAANMRQRLQKSK